MQPTEEDNGYPAKSLSQFGYYRSAVPIVQIHRQYRYRESAEAGFTGLNTRAGDLMTVEVKPLDSAIMASFKPTKFFTVLHSDNIMEIRESGIVVFD